MIESDFLTYSISVLLLIQSTYFQTQNTRIQLHLLTLQIKRIKVQTRNELTWQME